MNLLDISIWICFPEKENFLMQLALDCSLVAFAQMERDRLVHNLRNEVCICHVEFKSSQTH